MAKTKKVFLDANVVADILDNRRARHKESLLLMEKLIDEDCGIYISEDMISTLFYISKEKKQALEFFQNVIFTDWEVVGFGKNILSEAIELSMFHGADLEDAMQCLCAKQNDCSYVITNDVRFCDCGIEVFDVKSALIKI